MVASIVIEDGEEGVGTAKAQNVLKTALGSSGTFVDRKFCFMLIPVYRLEEVLQPSM